MENFVDELLDMYPYNFIHDILIFDENASSLSLTVYTPGLIEALLTLSKLEMSVILLKYKDGYTFGHISDELSISRKKCNEIIQNVIKKFRHPLVLNKILGCKIEDKLHLEECINDISKRNAIDSEILLRSVDKVFTPCISNILYRNNINDLYSLTMITREELLNMRGISESRINNIENKLKSFNLELNKSKLSKIKLMDISPSLIRINDLNKDELNEYIKNTLMRNGIYTLGDIADLTPNELRNIKGIGKDSYNKISILLTKYNMVQRDFYDGMRVFIIKCKKYPIDIANVFVSTIKSIGYNYTILKQYDKFADVTVCLGEVGKIYVFSNNFEKRKHPNVTVDMECDADRFLSLLGKGMV